MCTCLLKDLSRLCFHLSNVHLPYSGFSRGSVPLADEYCTVFVQRKSGKKCVKKRKISTKNKKKNKKKIKKKQPVAIVSSRRTSDPCFAS